ncbi:hypothetical protein HK102_001211 [Quaeritorhiza haematococci]|nr:hypothetical protein HK102_001211 [Quaeritorhiza haematococci]
MTSTTVTTTAAPKPKVVNIMLVSETGPNNRSRSSSAASNGTNGSNGKKEQVLARLDWAANDRKATNTAPPKVVSRHQYKGGEVVFVDPLDPLATCWWTAMVVPKAEISRELDVSSMQDNERVVRYFEDNTFSIVNVQELALFDPSTEPFLTFKKKCPGFITQPPVARALTYLKTGELPIRFKWALWGTSSNHATVSDKNASSSQSSGINLSSQSSSSTSSSKPSFSAQPSQPSMGAFMMSTSNKASATRQKRKKNQISNMHVIERIGRTTITVRTDGAVGGNKDGPSAASASSSCSSERRTTPPSASSTTSTSSHRRSQSPVPRAKSASKSKPQSTSGSSVTFVQDPLSLRISKQDDNCNTNTKKSKTKSSSPSPTTAEQTPPEEPAPMQLDEEDSNDEATTPAVSYPNSLFVSSTQDGKVTLKPAEERQQVFQSLQESVRAYQEHYLKITKLLRQINKAVTRQQKQQQPPQMKRQPSISPTQQRQQQTRRSSASTTTDQMSETDDECEEGADENETKPAHLFEALKQTLEVSRKLRRERRVFEEEGDHGSGDGKSPETAEPLSKKQKI